ncbi:helix-turn-helix transcriptional regulator [Burkholderia sp. MSMB0856]|uniref:helix-turn-helix transcriptional regulator n=1 Tax=Burkholderia sp. MSMB0856 TaxID=1637869 RepID=UPI000A48C282|nr:transcriptional regulator [Burkholderia sp. MSMB0856]
MQASTLNESQEPLLPPGGHSRLGKFEHLMACSPDYFRDLSKAGRAPQPMRLGRRLVVYSNDEVARWLADPANYRADHIETAGAE